MGGVSEWVWLTVEEVCYFLHIDLKIGDLDVYLEVSVHTINMVEHVLDNSWDDASHFSVHQLTLQRRRYITPGYISRV